MATNELKVTLCVEDDLDQGDAYQHVFPSFGSHEPRMTCACKPELIMQHPVVSVYWHEWSKEFADASLR